MERINIAELLKDCPQGMELDCLMYDNVYFKCIREHAIYPIVCYTIDSKGEKEEITFNWYGKYAQTDTAKCVIFPKGKTTWEGFQRPFRDGDIVISGNGRANEFAAIFKSNKNYLGNDGFNYYALVSLYTEKQTFKIDDWAANINGRLATEKEKQKLFQAIKDNGYRWNADNKTLEKLVKLEFNVGDWIIRNNKYTGIPVKVIEFNGYYNCELNGEIVNLTLNDVHNNFHLWTIQDAQDGDVLVSRSPFIYGKQGSYGGINWYTNKFIKASNFIFIDSPVQPATKEQCNILFQKIKEAGYKWNPETKTLEKLPKFKVGDRIKNKTDKWLAKRTIKSYDKNIGYFTTINDWVRIEDQDNWELVSDKFNINTLIPFESKVLVRHNKDNKWTGSFFSFIDRDLHSHCYKFVTTADKSYPMMIPFKGNEYLLGKTDDCQDFYKTWE